MTRELFEKITAEAALAGGEWTQAPGGLRNAALEAACATNGESVDEYVSAVVQFSEIEEPACAGRDAIVVIDSANADAVAAMRLTWRCARSLGAVGRPALESIYAICLAHIRRSRRQAPPLGHDDLARGWTEVAKGGER